jgi:hypothetical protein
MFSLTTRKPLFTIVPQFFILPNCSLGEKVATLCHSSLMRSVQSFEVDDNFILAQTLRDNQLRFDQVIRLTHLRISLWNFDQCVHLLNQLGSQLHSFTVTLGDVFENEPNISPEIISVNEIFRFDISINLFI